MHASSFRGIDRQPQATTGKHSQVWLPLLGLVSSPQLLAQDVVGRATFNGVLAEAARHSGMDDQDIAEALNICHGYMSRFMRGVAQQWAKRMVMFMRVTGSLAPLQWLADQLGCDVVQRDARAAEVAALKARLHAIERGAVA